MRSFRKRKRLLRWRRVPEALCELRHESDEVNLLRLHADDQGRVTFYACPSGGADTIELTLTKLVQVPTVSERLSV